MRYGPPSIFVGVTLTAAGLTAAGPVILHGHPERDCEPRVELCPASFLFSAPDEPAPEPSPLLISAMEMAFTASVSSNSALIVTRYSPANWVI
jgi:hypothetical protein